MDRSPHPTVNAAPPPRVSICISAYNVERFLGEALRSILGQTYRNTEIILVDNGSADRTFEVAGSFADERLRCFRLPDNIGGAQAENPAPPPAPRAPPPRRPPVGVLNERLLRYRHAKTQWSQRWKRLRTEPDRALDVMELYLEKDGWRGRLSAADLRELLYQRCDDATTRAANAVIQGDAAMARGL